jgi:hypothetical protein
MAIARIRLHAGSAQRDASGKLLPPGTTQRLRVAEKQAVGSLTTSATFDCGFLYATTTDYSLRR